MNYYQHHIGDYRRDTAHLTLLEHGIYRQLLDQYYLNERPVCIDDTWLMRSLCARTAEEIQAVKNVLADFFKLTDAGYLHKRCDVEIEAFHDKSKVASESAKARWEKQRAGAKKDADAMRRQCEGNANAIPTQCEGNANHQPSTINQEPRTRTSKPLASPSDDMPENFEEVWTAYPKRPGASKTDSLKAWKARIKAGATAREILDGVLRYAAYVAASRTEDRFIKQPQTFLGPGEHYKSDWAVGARVAPAQGGFDLAAAQRAATEEGRRRLFGNNNERTIDA